MLLSQNNFLSNLKEGKQVILFLGASSVGKSKWAKSLCTKTQKYPAFSAIEMDEHIANSHEIKDLFQNYPGQDAVEKMGNFFGKPWEDPLKYKEKETLYLQIEKEKMSKVYQEIKKTPAKQKVIDLTGSAIYCHPEIENITKLGLCIYLEASEEQYELMKEKYLEHPKPVCWNSLLTEWEKESEIKKLPERYAKLLQTRNILYKKYSDITIPWDVHRGLDKKEAPDSFLDVIASYLE